MNVLSFSPHFTPLHTPIGLRRGPGGVDLAGTSYTSISAKSVVSLAYPSPPMSDITSPVPPSQVQTEEEVTRDKHATSVPESSGTARSRNIQQLPRSHPASLLQSAEEVTRPRLPSPQRPRLPLPPGLPQTPPRPRTSDSYSSTPTTASSVTSSGSMQLHYSQGPPLPRFPGPSSYSGLSFSPTGYQYGYQQPTQMQNFPQYFGGPMPLAPQHVTPVQAQLRTTKPARRMKAHVASACVHCKKAHLSCDTQRPCRRCVNSNKQDTCYDVEHKKRGRPRLREQKETKRDVSRNTSSSASQHPPRLNTQLQRNPGSGMHSRSDSFASSLAPRLLPGDNSFLNYQTPISSPGSGTSGMSSHLSSASAFPLGSSFDQFSKPIVFLNMDLTILKPNALFQDLFAAIGDVRGRNISDLVEYTDTIQRLCNELRNERETRDPAYLAPINPNGEDEALQTVIDTDVERVTQGFSERVYTWNLRYQQMRPSIIRVSVKLAKTSCYFVAMVFQPLSQQQQNQPNQQQQQQHQNQTQNQQQQQQQHPPPPMFNSSSSFGAQMLPPSTNMSSSDHTASHMMRQNYPFMTHQPPSPSTSSDSSSPIFGFHNPTAQSVHSSISHISPTSLRSPGPFGYPSRSGSDASSYMSQMAPQQPQSSLSNQYTNYQRSNSMADARLLASSTSMGIASASMSMPSSIDPSPSSRRASGMDGLQLPPLRGNLTPPLLSPGLGDLGTMGTQSQGQRRYGEQEAESPESEKRRRLGIGEILE